MIEYTDKNYWALRYGLHRASLTPSEIVEYYPYDWESIACKMTDGSIENFFEPTHTCVPIYIPNNELFNYEKRLSQSTEYYDERRWLEQVSLKLAQTICYSGLYKMDISYITDISQTSLSKYNSWFKESTLNDSMWYLTGHPEIIKKREQQIKETSSIPSLYNAVKIVTALKHPLSRLFVPGAKTIDISKLKTLEEWDEIIDKVKERFPELANKTKSWYGTKYDELVLKLDDGSRYLIDINTFDQYLIYDSTMENYTDEIRYYDYDFRNDKQYTVYRFKLNFMSEAEYRKKFSDVLRWLMYDRQMNQQELSSDIGISRQMVSRYMHAQATPSLYVATRIAIVLNCSLNEFHII